MTTGVADARPTPQVSKYRLSHRVLAGAAILLCLFGAVESIRAIGRLLIRNESSAGFDALLQYPLWGVAHFLPGLMFMLLVPVQLWAGFRTRHRVVHRWSGRVLVAVGIFLGLSGVAFPFFMPERVFSERVVMSAFFLLFLFFLSKAFIAARRRDFARHREWMIRWFAIGLGVTTQRVLLPIFIAVVGVTDVRSFWEIFVTATWLAAAIQVLIAEWWLHTTRQPGLEVKPV